MQRQTCSSVCLHCCQKSLHTSCHARTIHWTLYSSASKLGERQREGERGEGGRERSQYQKAAKCFFCLHFFVSLRLMENSQMSVFDMLIFFLHSSHMKGRESYAFGENKKRTFCRLCPVMAWICSWSVILNPGRQHGTAALLFPGAHPHDETEEIKSPESGGF